MDRITEGKEAKAYAQTIARIKTIINKENVGLPSKVPASDMEQIVTDLFKDEHDALKEKLKKDLHELLKTHMVFKAKIAEKAKELDNEIKSKQKEFVKKASEVFNQIDNIGSLISGYTESLVEAVEGNKEEPKEE